jgi:methylated-DNA-[protein]-cysteine S-methyltransferase
MYGRVTARSSRRAVGVRVECVDYTVPGWGTGEIWMRGRVLLAHELRYELAEAGAHPPKGAHGPPTGTLAGEPSRVGNGFVPRSSQPGASGDPRGASAADLVDRFRAFLGGEPVAFDDVDLELAPATPFQRALTSALRAIPRGEVVTYGELAALAGRPGAARAVGTFCATNRFALVVPCHRVVAASGIGGYGPDGVPIKRRLLALEGVSL